MLELDIVAAIGIGCVGKGRQSGRGRGGSKCTCSAGEAIGGSL